MLLNKKENACIRACHDCEDACLESATLCVENYLDRSKLPCITLDMECINICRLLMEAIEQGGSNIKDMCLKCAEIADKCGKECEKHSAEHCQRCAKSCRRCAEACRSYVGAANVKSGIFENATEVLYIN